MWQPRLILLCSGKRKSGKDFICERLKSKLGDEKCCIIRISGPLKRLYAHNHNLEWDELMSDGPYKEQYRLDMIKWSDEIRNKDPGYFCKATCEAAPAKELWIVSDIRRKTDIKWFNENFENIVTVRIGADLDIRKARGWAFTNGVDDAQSECDLDDFYSWDLSLTNNSGSEADRAVESILKIVENKCQ